MNPNEPHANGTPAIVGDALRGLDRPTSRSLRYREAELTEPIETQLTRYRCANVGFIFQFCNHIPSLPAEEQVQLVTGLAAFCDGIEGLNE